MQFPFLLLLVLVLVPLAVGSGGTFADLLRWAGFDDVYDFGDAPDSYKTLMGSDGARHLVTEECRLGIEVDMEPDGQPTPNADGDDKSHTDDEDGVAFRSTLYKNATVSIDVEVTGTVESCLLDA